MIGQSGVPLVDALNAAGNPTLATVVNVLGLAGLAIAGLFQWLANFGITMTFPIMLASIGLVGAYGFYAVSAVASIFFVIYFVKETRGKELEEMAYE